MRNICMITAGALLAAISGMAQNGETIVVQMTNDAGAPMSEVRTAETAAGSIFERAGITVSWVDCPPVSRERGPDQVCKQPADPRLFVVAITPECPAEQSDTALGFAVLAGRSNHAAACYSKIVDFAGSSTLRPGLLAAVIAHEIGHLVFRSTAHSERLMQPQWTAADVQAMVQLRLKFTRAQSQALQQMLSMR